MRVPGYFYIALLCTNTWTRFKQSGSDVGIKLAVTTQKAIQSQTPNGRREHNMGLIYHVSQVHFASYSDCQPVIARLLPVWVHPSWKCSRDPPLMADAVAMSQPRARERLAAFCGTGIKGSECSHKLSTAFWRQPTFCWYYRGVKLSCASCNI